MALMIPMMVYIASLGSLAFSWEGIRKGPIDSLAPIGVPFCACAVQVHCMIGREWLIENTLILSKITHTTRLKSYFRWTVWCNMTRGNLPFVDSRKPTCSVALHHVVSDQPSLHHGTDYREDINDWPTHWLSSFSFSTVDLIVKFKNPYLLSLLP